MDGFSLLLTVIEQDPIRGLYFFSKVTFVASFSMTLMLALFSLVWALSNGVFSKCGLVVAPSMSAFSAFSTGLGRRGLMRREAPVQILPTLTDLMAAENKENLIYYIDDTGKINTYNRN